MNINEKNFSKYIDLETSIFTKTLDSKDDLILLVLRFHLIIENLMERIIVAKLKRGDKIIEHGNLTFNQKLHLIDSFDVLDNSYIQSIKNLNTIRNKCSHEKSKVITGSDIDCIGRPLGNEYTRIKRETTDSLYFLIRKAFLLLFYKVFEHVALIEFDDVLDKDGKFLESDSTNQQQGN
jgi:hypothetical protein